jgi:peptide/nickel transport system permease protein
MAAVPAGGFWAGPGRSPNSRSGWCFSSCWSAGDALPALSDIDPTKISVRERFLPPVFLEGGTWAHPLGTDQLGRDLFVRSLVGLQNALMISLPWSS